MSRIVSLGLLWFPTSLYCVYTGIAILVMHPFIPLSYVTAWSRKYVLSITNTMGSRLDSLYDNQTLLRIYMKIKPSHRHYMYIRHTEPYIQCKYYDNGLEMYS